MESQEEGGGIKKKNVCESVVSMWVCTQVHMPTYEDIA